MSISNNKTSHLISSQLPGFCREDHETFVEFMENYYQFLEQSGQVLNESKNFLRNKDVDLADEPYLQKLYDNFITLIPNNVLADKTLILKHAKDFFRSRGSEKSVRFLLRILLNKEIEFYYPKRDILKASDGKWFIEKSIKVTDVKVNNAANSIAYSNFINKTIRGNTSNATAIVEGVDVYYDLGELVTEIKLSNEYRSFTENETIFTYYTEEGNDYFLSANLFSGVITSVSLIDGGSGYVENDYVPIEGGGGTGAQIVISQVTKGELVGIIVLEAGAGFRANDQLLITGGGGSGAAANVYTVDESGTVHPNSYNIVTSQILLEANTLLGNSIFNNLHGTTINSWISNAVSSWVFANCGPIESCLVLNSGNNYSSIPTLDVVSNTMIRTLGILGRMEIIDGGLNYSVSDKLEFNNPIGAFGSGASGNVTAVEANGKITSIAFEGLPGEVVGGLFYDSDALPTVNVSSNTGNGANIIVTSILGDGESLSSTSSTIGTILELTLTSGGSGYTSVPTLNLANMSSGSNGVATAEIITGTFTYPGRYLNDDGHLSSYNFLQDKEYYHGYSYVVRVGASINDYRKAVKELTHPAGLRLFGHYLVPPETVSISVNNHVYVTNNIMKQATYKIHTSDVIKTGTYNVKTTTANFTPQIYSGVYGVSANASATYSSRQSDITLYSNSHGLVRTDNVYVQFFTNYANITNGMYTVKSSNTDYLIVGINNGNSSFVQLAANTSNLTLSSGYGATNNYLVFSNQISNSNVIFTTGDSLNVRGNLVTVVYSAPNSNTIIVSPAVTGNLVANLTVVVKAPFSAYGNARIFKPTFSIRSPSTGIIPGDEVYLKFNSSDTSLQNALYTVTSANSSYIKVDHKDIQNTTSYSGNVNVYIKTLNITNSNNQFANGENVYLRFTSGDLPNSVNTIYTVLNSSNNAFSVLSDNVVTAVGNVNILTNNVSCNISGHGFESNDSVYIWFQSGDTPNVTNQYYTITAYSSSLFGFDVEDIPTSNGNISVYRNYMNVTINRTAHGFLLGNTIRSMFETGDLPNVSNGLYTVNSVANTNTCNILHSSITISSNLANLVYPNNGIVYVSLS